MTAFIAEILDKFVSDLRPRQCHFLLQGVCLAAQSGWSLQTSISHAVGDEPTNQAHEAKLYKVYPNNAVILSFVTERETQAQCYLHFDSGNPSGSNDEMNLLPFQSVISGYRRLPVKLRKVLILHKKSTYQIQALEHRESRFLKLLEENSEVVTRVKTAHSEHTETLELLEQELLKRGVEYRSIARAELTAKITDVDLVISVGGDGTFLDLSHYVDNIPMLGINSASSSSFGHFCLGNQKNLKEILSRIEDGDLQTRPILRLELWLNGSLLPELVLNEVLVAHSNPAATSRLFMQFGEEKEEQRSSGVWIGTPGGSTGSLRSAGGEVLPITDNRYLYIVREPCVRPGESYKFLKGTLDHSQEIRIKSQMRTGVLHIDGQHIDYQFSLGDELIIKGSPHYLRAFIDERVNDRFV